MKALELPSFSSCPREAKRRSSSEAAKHSSPTRDRTDSIVYSDALPSYNALDISAFRHFRINHSTSFAKGQTHINGIENFWNQAKRHLRKYNGIPQHHFNLFLKDCDGGIMSIASNHGQRIQSLAQRREYIRNLLCQPLYFHEGGQNEVFYY